MRSMVMGLFFFLSLLVSGCGNGTDEDRRSGGGTPPAGTGVVTPLPTPIGSPPGGTPATDTTGNTFFDLVGPELPEGVNVVPLRAALLTSTGQAIVVSSVHLGTQATPTPVSAGTYTLTFLNENDTPTAFTQTVIVRPGISNRLSIGSVLVDPASAVQPTRTATVSFPYAIGSTEGTLKIIVPNLNTVIDLPPRAFQWQGIGSNGTLPPITIDAGATLLTREWGSVLVQKEITDTVALFSSNGAVIFPETLDGVEYLLPATPQEQGCMVYLGVINNLTTRTITLCSDAILHVILNER